jgi:hypothetical protein
VTLQVGDKAVVIPLRDGGRVAVRSGTISVGDKVVLIPGANGQIYAIRPASPQVGDKVILYPLRNGGHVCLASADDEGGSSPSVMPPGNFSAIRTGPGTADLEWALGAGNTGVRIVRLPGVGQIPPDRYPRSINDGSVAYTGDGTKHTDTGLDGRYAYYYCAWGKAGSRYSNGYLMAVVGAWGSQSDPVLVCEAWHRAVTKPGEVVTYGPIRYAWDGQGQVYVSASPSEVAGIMVDGHLDISGPQGSKSFLRYYLFYTIADITAVLRPGINAITVSIRDNNVGANIGTLTPLYIMRAL